jgi:ABC-2 type transport system permease protein
MSQWIQLFRSGARTGWANIAVELTPATVLGSRIPRTILQAVFFILISYAAGGSELAKFALIGNTMHAAVFHSVIEMSVVIELEKWLGTMPYLIASPANWFPAMMGRSLAGYVEGLARILLVLLILVPFFGGDLTAFALLRAAPIFILTVASASALGWLSGAMSLPTRWGMLICNTIGYVMMLTGGVNFPITALPSVIQWFGRILPMTNGLLAIRAVIDGSSYSDVSSLILSEIAIGIIYGVFAWRVFSHRLNVARQTGNIEQF